MASIDLVSCLWASIVSVHKQAKKNQANKKLGQYPAILTEQAWSITLCHLQQPRFQNILVTSLGNLISVDLPERTFIICTRH